MSIPVVTRDYAMNSIPPDHVSLHTAFPGAIGSNEVTGGSYARGTIAYSTSSGGQRTQTADANIAVPATTVRWLGAWQGSTFLFPMANGGATPINFVAMPSTDQLAATAHGFSDGTKVAFYYGTPPGGLTEGTIYYTRDGAADSFRVAVTAGGAAIDLTGPSSFGCVVGQITEDVYASPGTHTVRATTMAVPV